MANFSKLYEQYVEQVYCFLRELSGDDSFAEELTWKTFYQAFLHVDSFENRSGVFEWLCEIGENVYLREMKRQKRNFFEGKRQNPVFEGEVSAAERKKRIRRGLRKIRRKWICSILAVAAAILLGFVGAALIVGGLFAGGLLLRTSVGAWRSGSAANDGAYFMACLCGRLTCGGGLAGK